MPRDFYPRRETDIVRFTANFGTRVTADPQLYGLTPQKVAGYMDLQRAFAACHLAVNTPSGDFTSAYAAKETARVRLEKATRPLVRVICCTLDVSDELRATIGLKPRAVRRREIAAPKTAPGLEIVGMIGPALQVRLRDTAGGQFRKPRDVWGATLFGAVGDEPPTGSTGWVCMGNRSRVSIEARFNSSLPPGTKVWLTACWVTHTGAPSPSCTPVGARIPDAVHLAGAMIRRAA